MEKAIKRYWPVFVLPTMAAFIIGFIAPFLYGIFLSFCKFTTVVDWKWVGIKNYTRIFFVNGKLDTTFIHSLWYTALFTVVTVLIINVVAFAIAMALTKGIKGTNFFRTSFFLPNLIGGIVLSYIWLMIFNSVLANYSKTIPTNQLNAWLADIRETGHTISKGKAVLRMKYITQTGTCPPVFTLFANRPDIVDDNYERFLENRMRKYFDLEGTPIRLKFKKKD